MKGIGSCKLKLDEAKFFLEQLHKHYSHIKTFDYYLSAFISAARSVLWIMKQEYGERADWKDWYDKKKLSDEEERLFKQINDLRVRTTKIKPIRTELSMNVVIDATNLSEEIREKILKLPGRKFAAYVDKPNEEGKQTTTFEIDEVKVTGIIENSSRTIKEMPDKNILAVCDEYYSVLKGIVEECLQKLG